MADHLKQKSPAELYREQEAGKRIRWFSLDDEDAPAGGRLFLADLSGKTKPHLVPGLGHHETRLAGWDPMCAAVII